VKKTSLGKKLPENIGKLLFFRIFCEEFEKTTLSYINISFLLNFCLIYIIYFTNFSSHQHLFILCDKPMQKTCIFIHTITIVMSLYWLPCWLQASMGMFTFSYYSSLLRVHWHGPGLNVRLRVRLNCKFCTVPGMTD
jgi:hypothetical protein